MILAVVLSSLVIGDGPHAGNTATAPAPSVAPPIVIKLHPTVIGSSFDALRSIVDLMNTTNVDETWNRRYLTLVKQGKALELATAVHVEKIDDLSPNSMVDRRTGQKLAVFAGKIREGDHSGRIGFFLAQQVDTRSSNTVDNRPLDDRELAVYKDYKSARAAAMSKAMSADLSTRKAIAARELNAIPKKLSKKHDIKIPDILAIIARGEHLDGTAERRIRAAGAARVANETKAMNDLQLMAMDEVMGQQARNALTNNARSQSSSSGHPGGPVWFNPRDSIWQFTSVPVFRPGR